MLVVLGLGLMLVALTFALKVEPLFDVEGTWALWWLGGGLLVLGFLAPDPFVGVFLGWVGLQVPLYVWVPLGRTIAVMSLLGQQGCVLVWGALYVALVLSGTAAKVLPALAVCLVAWGLFNAGAAAWSRVRGALPIRWVGLPGWPEQAYVGSSHMLAWLLSSACLATGFLAWSGSPWWLAALPWLAVPVVWTKNVAAPGSALIAALVTGVAGGIIPPLVLPAAFLLGWAIPAVRRRVRSSLSARWEVWGMAWADRTWLGRGLGFTTTRKYVTHGGHHHWDWLHNDWLQVALELGPLPVVLALGYLGWHAWGLSATPLAVWAFAQVTMTAVYSLVYFPLRMPGQAFVLLLAMAALS